MAPILTLIGTGDALGVPRVYCDCAVCAEARTTGVNRRRRCSAVVSRGDEYVWLDCGPDWRGQMESLGQRGVSTVLITHAHHDHIGGLPDLADAVRWTRAECRVIGPASVLDEVTARYPWLPRSLQFTPLGEGVELLGYRVRAWEVCHGRNGRSHAYRFDGPDGAWAYCPDSISLSEAERAPLRGLDLLVLGTAYYKEEIPASNRSLYDMVEAVELLADVQPKRAVFTHLSHGVDVREAYDLPSFVTVGRDGLAVDLNFALRELNRG